MTKLITPDGRPLVGKAKLRDHLYRGAAVALRGTGLGEIAIALVKHIYPDDTKINEHVWTGARPFLDLVSIYASEEMPARVVEISRVACCADLTAGGATDLEDVPCYDVIRRMRS